MDCIFVVAILLLVLLVYSTTIKFCFHSSILFLTFFFLNNYQELRLDQFVTHEIQFDDINKAFDLLLTGESLRCVIWMDK